MSAEAHLADADLDAALAALQDQVRNKPADAKLRIFLFQLLSVMGDWKRAVTQLKLSADMDPIALPMAQTYREGIICEVFREKVFAGEKIPLLFGEPQEWAALLIEANQLLAQGKAAEAAQLRDKAFEQAPAMPGTLNGAPFDWVADADMRLGPVLEAVVNGRYFWMPFNAIAEMKMEEPVDLRDCVWMPANITLENGGEIVALIPTRYSGTLEHGDSAAKLSRATEWADLGNETYVGRGQRLLTTDSGDVPLMDVRHLVMGSGAPAVATEDEASDG